MPGKDDIESGLDKARAFFQRAEEVAATDNFDYAIDMYLEGLRCVPDALEDGHIEIHELALLRSVKGGKKPSMMEKVKYLRGKTALEQMINAEYLFAKDRPAFEVAPLCLAKFSHQRIDVTDQPVGGPRPGAQLPYQYGPCPPHRASCPSTVCP